MRNYQLAIEPLCRMCQSEGVTMAATVVDHIEPHRGDYKKFWFGKLQSLCAWHHDAYKQNMEKRGFICDIDVSGYPIDPHHPTNKASW
jgi:hypothetical protein